MIQGPQGQALDGRERLHRLMGLSIRPSNWRIPPELPMIPDEEIAWNDVESIALAQRLDLAARRRRVAVAQNLYIGPAREDAIFSGRHQFWSELGTRNR